MDDFQFSPRLRRPTPVIAVTFVEGRLRQMPRNLSQIDEATGLFGRGNNRFGQCPVGALEQIERQAALGVMVRKRKHQRSGRLIGRPRPDRLDQPIGLRDWLAIGRTLAFGLQHQIIRQAKPHAVGHAPDLVLAIGVKGGEARGGTVGRVGKLQGPLRAAVAHDQLAAREAIGQGDNHARHHPIVLLAIAVLQEESTCFVD